MHAIATIIDCISTTIDLTRVPSLESPSNAVTPSFDLALAPHKVMYVLSVAVAVAVPDLVLYKCVQF